MPAEVSWSAPPPHHQYTASSGNTNANNPLAGQNDPNEDRAAFFADSDLQNTLRDIFAELRKDREQLKEPE